MVKRLVETNGAAWDIGSAEAPVFGLKEDADAGTEPGTTPPA